MAEPKPKLRPKFGRMFLLTFFLCLCVVMSDLISSRTRKLVNLICLLLLQIVFYLNTIFIVVITFITTQTLMTSDVRQVNTNYENTRIRLLTKLTLE